jgi:hypothetical protein
VQQYAASPSNPPIPPLAYPQLRHPSTSAVAGVSKKDSTTVGRRSAFLPPVHLTSTPRALMEPAMPPLTVTLPRTTMAWRSWLPVLGPLMQMLDSATDAISTLFALRKAQAARMPNSATTAAEMRSSPSRRIPASAAAESPVVATRRGTGAEVRGSAQDLALPSATPTGRSLVR